MVGEGKTKSFSPDCQINAESLALGFRHNSLNDIFYPQIVSVHGPSVNSVLSVVKSDLSVVFYHGVHGETRRGKICSFLATP
jgi:hypothetical protein